MFLGHYEGCSLSFEVMQTPYLHLEENGTECYFIGEILSDPDEIDYAFHQFIKERQPEHILFLRGNYQTIIRISDELWMFSDLANVRPLYHAKQGSSYLFSSHLTPIQKQVQSTCNVSWFQRSLSVNGFCIEEETPYQHIKRVPSGFGLLVSPQGERMVQAWNVDQEAPLSWEQAQRDLREELTASVRLRCHGKRVTSDLSGGLDSSTITWIASREQPIKSLTIIGKEEDEDGKIAREVAEVQKNIQHFIWQQDDIPLIYSHMDQIRTDIPIPFLWSANKVRKKMRWASENHSEIHFSGEGGDTVLGADFTYLVDLIRQGKWKTFYSHVYGWATQKKESPFLWISGALCKAFHLPFQPRQRNPLSTVNNLADWFKFSPMVRDVRFSRYQGVNKTMYGIQYLGYVSQGLKDLANQEQVHLCVPYLDHNVIRVCMRTPSELKMNPYELKPLLKRAFQDELPSSLLNRNTKGDYTSDVYYGMNQQFSWFQEYFREMALSEMGLVDLSAFQQSLHRLSLGVPVKLPEFHHTLSLELWLRQNFR
ncbi:asparagine synthetase B (glutamine-hydrolyzing) [Croceifilum oryzae]|uniref:asparagine synthase (glutamine-hydrolyzing) n=1 Tax=Croceifilum oryzae TaxID=1553429 RepID=A0AAJ1WT81_9BACL|nr:asparagine synthase-related protein [Croceifilum oryzae]MDQ0418148.1 asparagine synthetase B (glutamine-hydrolyzing) [Croceifilum oryzae]